MKTVRLYEVGEEVQVAATIVGVVVDNGEIKYKLKSPITGREYTCLFTDDQIIPKNKPEIHTRRDS